MSPCAGLVDLHREGRDAILFPPKESQKASTTSDIPVTIKGARKHPSEIADCDITSGLVSLKWQGSVAKVTLSPKSFFAASTYQAEGKIDRGAYTDPLLAVEKFRSDLLDRQAKGCLTPDENTRLRRSMVENLPLPSAVAYFFLLGSYDINDYFDLTPDFRMQVTSPIYPSGVAPSPDRLRGYETANYVFRAEPRSDRLRLS